MSLHSPTVGVWKDELPSSVEVKHQHSKPESRQYVFLSMLYMEHRSRNMHVGALTQRMLRLVGLNSVEVQKELIHI